MVKVLHCKAKNFDTQQSKYEINYNIFFALNNFSLIISIKLDTKHVTSNYAGNFWKKSIRKLETVFKRLTIKRFSIL
jgi:hypothetical protein